MTSLCKNQFRLTKAAVSDKALDSLFERLYMLLEEPTDTRHIDNPEIVAFINDQVEVFNKVAENSDVRINKDVLKHLLTNISENLLKEEESGQLQQLGGAPRLLLNQGPTKQKSSLLPNLVAFAALLFSVFLFYLAYHRLNVLMTRLTGESVIEYQRAAFKDVFTNLEELTFLQYMWKSISTLGCNMAYIQSNNLTNILKMKLQLAIPDFAIIAQENCIMPSATTGLLGLVEKFTNLVLTSDTSANCEMQTIATLGKQFMAQQAIDIELIGIQTMAEVAQIQTLTKAAVVSFGYPAVQYFWTMYNLTSQKSKRMLNSGNRFEALEPGDEKYLGRGGRKTRRNKKTKRTKSKRKATRRM